MVESHSLNAGNLLSDLELLKDVIADFQNVDVALLSADLSAVGADVTKLMSDLGKLVSDAKSQLPQNPA